MFVVSRVSLICKLEYVGDCLRSSFVCGVVFRALAVQRFRALTVYDFRVFAVQDSHVFAVQGFRALTV